MSTSTSTNHSNTRGYSFRQRNTIKNISWKGNLNARLAHLLSDHGLTLPTLATCAEWADVLGIGDHDPTGRRVRPSAPDNIELI